MMKLIPLSLACFALASCQTPSLVRKGPGPGDINLFEIPPEMSRIVLPEGYVADRVEVSIDGDITDEIAYFGTSHVRYTAAPDGYLAATTKTDFLRISDRDITRHKGEYIVPVTQINYSNNGPGHYAVTLYSTGLCLFSITSAGKSTIAERQVAYPGKLFVLMCSPRDTLTTRSNFIKEALSFIENVVIREPSVNVSNAAN